MKLKILEGNFGIAKLPATSEVPAWALKRKNFLSITYTQDELSIVCDERSIPPETQSEKHRRALKVEGPLDFALTGILSSLLQPLAAANMSVFTLSTFDTDYILIHESLLNEVLALLRSEGHEIDLATDQS